MKKDILDRTRAAVAYCNINPNDKDVQLNAFMDIFHPKKARDKKYMLKLKRAMKEEKR